MRDPDIRSLAEGKTLKDNLVTGLHVRSRRTKKTWFLYYRTKAGAERRPKLGEYPTLSIAEARRVAKELLTQVALGKDPSAAWQADREAPTMDDLWKRYWTEYAPRKKSRQEDHRLWATFIAPSLSNLRVDEVSIAQLSGLHSRMRSAPIQANRVLSRRYR